MSVETISKNAVVTRPVEIDVISASKLAVAEIAAWRAIQESNRMLVSPYFAPEFTQLVASVRDDVFVAVLHQQGEPVGFFPFQRDRWRIGKPAGGVVSDYQGVIVSDEMRWDPANLIRACGLRAWDFDHLISAQTEFAPYERLQTCSPIMDLSRGYEAYVADCRSRGSKTIRDLGQLHRKLEREHGTVSFVPHSDDSKMLETLIQWKTAQFVRTGVRNLFAEPWFVDFVRRLSQMNTLGFAGIFSVLKAGERPVAMELNLRSKSVLHGSLLVYDSAYARFSPGLLILLHSAQHAASIGLQSFDLGKGDMPYKQQLATGAVPISEGSVECSTPLSLIRQFRGTAAAAIRRSPLRSPARFAKWCLQTSGSWIASKRR